MQRRELSDHPLARALTWAADLIALNLLWLLCSVPVFTAGAAFSAMYTVMRRLLAREPVKTASDFFSAFRESFKTATPIWLLVLLGAAVFASDLWFAVGQTGALKTLFLIVSILVGAVVFSVLAWSFPLIAQFENTVKSHLRNALAVAFCNPLLTVGIWLCYAVPVALALLLPFNVVLGFGFLYIFMGISGPCALAAMLARKAFAKMDTRISTELTEESEDSERSDYEPQ